MIVVGMGAGAASAPLGRRPFFTATCAYWTAPEAKCAAQGILSLVGRAMVIPPGRREPVGGSRGARAGVHLAPGGPGLAAGPR